MKTTKNVIEKMLDFLPTTINDYMRHIEKYGEVLETVVVEDIFMPEIIKLLQMDDNIELLTNIFNYFEEVSDSGDEHLLNTFSVTVLEILGNDKTILETARKYMGPKTIQLQIEADRALGRI